MEPTVASARHAPGMNNHVYFHSLTERGCPMVNEREYLGTVESVKLNRDYAAVPTEGRVHLQPLGGEAWRRARASAEDGKDVACVALTKEFLIYSTRRGTVAYFYLPDLVQISEFRHERAVLRLFPNELGTRLVFVDAEGQALLYNPVSEQTFAVPRPGSSTSSIVSVMWDSADAGVFVAVDAKSYHAFVHAPHSVKGGGVTLVGATKRASGSRPCSCTTAWSPRRAPTAPSATPRSHGRGHRRGRRKGGDVERLKQCFQQNLALLRMSRAWDVALLVDQRELYAKLGVQALQHLDVALAVRVYRQLMDAGMVMTLQKLQSIEDANLLAGHVALVFDDYPTAQELFLQSSRPVAALEMRRDLLQWEQALKLAKTLAPEQVPYLSREFAQQLEFKASTSRRSPCTPRGCRRARSSSSRAARRRRSSRRTCAAWHRAHDAAPGRRGAGVRSPSTQARRSVAATARPSATGCATTRRPRACTRRATSPTRPPSTSAPRTGRPPR